MRTTINLRSICEDLYPEKGANYYDDVFLGFISSGDDPGGGIQALGLEFITQKSGPGIEVEEAPDGPGSENYATIFKYKNEYHMFKYSYHTTRGYEFYTEAVTKVDPITHEQVEKDSIYP
jgi:hypothetical protein